MVMTAPAGLPLPAGPPPGRQGYTWGSVVAEFDATSGFPGLEVEFSAPSIGEYMAILMDTAGAFEDDDGLWATLEQRTLCEHLIAWNVTYPQHHPRAGEPVPTTLAGFLSLPRLMARAIGQEWIDRTTRVSGPLDGSSPSGAITALGELETQPNEGSSPTDQQDGSTSG